MGYYVRALPHKKKSPNWKIQYISTRKKDRKENSVAKITKTTWDISKDRWSSLGFHQSMTVDEVQARARQLNAQLQLKRQEEVVQKIKIKEADFQLRNTSALPEIFVAEFEQRFIQSKLPIPENKKKSRTTQRFTAWRAAQRIIVEIGLEPTSWFYHQDKFYEIFFQKKFSVGYAGTILIYINLWGNFITRKLCQPYYPVRKPKGYERQRIIESSYTKPYRKKASESITPEHLINIVNKINTKDFNWLFVSVWLGLRPQEIDNLHDNTTWKMETLPTGRKLLWVFQTKIIALPSEDRWKPIPILFDEQHFALKIISDKTFKRPLTKTIRKHIGNGHDCYGGRKGFVDLMLSKNQTLENISIWMGHSTLNRTWRSYKNKRIYHAG